MKLEFFRPLKATEGLYVDNVEIVQSNRVYKTEAGNPPTTLTSGEILMSGEYIHFTYDVKVNNPCIPDLITNVVSLTSTLQPTPLTAKNSSASW